MLERGVVRFITWCLGCGVASGAVAALGVFFAGATSCLPDLTVVPIPPGCGNGVADLDDGEACDPGDAGALGCSASCAIVCEAGVVDDATSHCYFWTPPVLSLDDAIQVCGAHGAHPVHFVDMAELSFVAANTSQKTLENAAPGASWLALEKGVPNDAGLVTYNLAPIVTQLPGWASSCTGCFAYTDAADIPLSTNLIAAPCVNWRHALNLTWTQAACTLGVTDAGQVTNPVLCEREPPGSFSAPCNTDAGGTCIEVPLTHATKRYELASVPANFTNAESACAARGGMLVKFDSSAEREEVVAEVLRATSADFWIGLYFDSTAIAWMWVDKTPAPLAPPTPWADLEPAISVGAAAAIHSELNSYSTRLARAEDQASVLPYVCQFSK